MGLTQTVFGKLVKVSAVSVVKWEKIDGKIEIRKKATMARIQGLKGKGKREAAVMVGEERKITYGIFRTFRREAVLRLGMIGSQKQP